MGYFTLYTLTITHGGVEVDKSVKENIFKFIKDTQAGLTCVHITRNGQGDSWFCYPFQDTTLELHQDYKWYDCEYDLYLLSGQFPDLLFTLDGKGEEAGDIWTHVYQDGKLISQYSLYKVKVAVKQQTPRTLTSFCIDSLIDNPKNLNFAAIPHTLWDSIMVRITEKNMRRLVIKI